MTVSDGQPRTDGGRGGLPQWEPSLPAPRIRRRRRASDKFSPEAPQKSRRRRGTGLAELHVRRARADLHPGAGDRVPGGVVGLRRSPAVHQVDQQDHPGAGHPGGAAGLRARPELHLGAAHSGAGNADDGDRHADADNHAGADADANHHPAAVWPAADCLAASVRSARHDAARPGADTRTGAGAPTSAANTRLTLMARLLSARSAGASSPGALMAWQANVTETHRYTGRP